MDNKVEDTPRMIEKFTNEEGQVDVNKMASKMSSIKEQNFTYKRIILFSSLFLVVAIGLMISANVLGTYVLKDTRVKNDKLTTNDGTPVQVGQSLYNIQVYLFTDTDVLDGLKYLEIPTLNDGVDSVLHMEIDSYIITAGKKIVFIGQKYIVTLNRHNYQVFLNDDSFDPLALANATDSTGTISSNNAVGDKNNNEDDSTEQSEFAKRSIFNSEELRDIKKRVHSTVEGHKKRHVHGEGDITQEFVVLNGTGIVPASSATRSSIINLSYHGGSLVTNGIIVPIVWYDTTHGNFNAANLKTCYSNMLTFYGDLLKSKLLTSLTPGKKGSDPQCKVAGVDSHVHYLVPDSSRKKQTLADSDISSQLISWLNVKYDATKPNSTIPQNSSNKLNYMYMIFFPSGIKLSSGFCSSYCGFHTYTNGYNYAVLPWVGDCMGACGMSTYTSTFGGSTCGSLQSVTAHETIEMANDPYFNAYYDSQGNECADKCAWSSPACFKNPQTGNSYCIQQQWNHTASSSSAYDAGCSKNLQY